MLEILGGSWAVISGGRSPLRRVTIVTLLITPHITTHEPPSRVLDRGFVPGSSGHGSVWKTKGLRASGAEEGADVDV